jgi:hypothetical protein
MFHHCARACGCEDNERADRLVEQSGTAMDELTFLMSSGTTIEYQAQQIILSLQL